MQLLHQCSGDVWLLRPPPWARSGRLLSATEYFMVTISCRVMKPSNEFFTIHISSFNVRLWRDATRKKFPVVSFLKRHYLRWGTLYVVNYSQRTGSEVGLSKMNNGVVAYRIPALHGRRLGRKDVKHDLRGKFCLCYMYCEMRCSCVLRLLLSKANIL